MRIASARPTTALACLGLLWLVALAPGADDDATAGADVPGWPRTWQRNGNAITVYQPQPERFDGNRLDAYAVVAVAKAGAAGEPSYGTMWFTARLDIDREARIAVPRTVTIERVRFPAGKGGDAAEQALAGFLKRDLTAPDLVIDLDRLAAGLESASGVQAEFRHEPPRILVRTAPAVLVPIDGAPRREANGKLERVVNTPAFLVIEDGRWWLRLADDWAIAPDLKGPWTTPSEGSTAVTAAARAAGFPSHLMRLGKPPAPEVIVSEDAAALLVFEGEPRWEPLDSTSGDSGLQRAANCAHDVLRLGGTHYVLLAGRWYAGDRLADGAGWKHVAPDALPAEFAAIPAGSRWAYLRVHVAGTPEAVDAAYDALVPQTARVDRKTLKPPTVTYDGQPRFEAIPGVAATWAVNASAPVFQVGAVFYCCVDGIWYQAAAAQGPWQVATAIPDDLHRIPADHPQHNVSYVYIYEDDVDYVWVGYYPGYLHWYCHRGCPIWGAGWHWHGWYGPGHCYPRPVTYGVGVVYNPGTGGWGVVVGARGPNGGVAWAWKAERGNQWWGPAAPTPYKVDPRTRAPVMNADTARAAGFDRAAPSLYDRVPGAQRVADASRREPSKGGATAAAGIDGRIFADRDGNVMRRDDQGRWQERVDGQWRDVSWGDAKPAAEARARPTATPPAKPAAPTSAPPAAAAPRPAPERLANVERHYQARERAATARSARGR